MRLYAESSAELAWLLGEPRGRKTLELLSNAELIIASDLTLVECDRVLIRAVTLEEIDEAEAARRRATLNLAASHWNVVRLQGEVVSRARRAFPSEPVRTLDTLHLSCALFARSLLPELTVLSLDRRLRSAARILGLPLAPA